MTALSSGFAIVPDFVYDLSGMLKDNTGPNPITPQSIFTEFLFKYSIGLFQSFIKVLKTLCGNNFNRYDNF